jgi:cell division protein FtsQ
MPLSNRYTARVPIISGEVLLHLEALKTVLLIIGEDSFLRPMITEIVVDENANFQLSLKQEKYKLLLGPAVDVAEKLTNFKAFYQNMRVNSEQEQFKKVDLRFNSQVVAAK